MKMTLWIISSLICTSFFRGALASELRSIEWSEISNENGVEVFAAKGFNHESGLVPIKFKTTLNDSTARVLTVLADNKRKMEWVPRAVEARTLERKSETDITVYYKYDLPWPLNDRDFIVKNLGVYNKKENMISVDIRSVEHKDDPALKNKDAIRGTTYDGYSIIRPLSDNQTYVEMALLNDFGGRIPAWIINIIQRKWPARFIANLKIQLKKEDIVINKNFIFKKK